jgi:hypothetical protein
MTPTAAPPPLRWSAYEAIAAVSTSALFLASCTWIHVDPVDRLGQISGLASLGLRFFGFSIVLIGALVWATRRGGPCFALMQRLVCAAAAALASAFVAGGAMVALHGTPWGFNALGGDVGVIVERALALHRGESLPPLYPPLSIHVLHLYSDVVGIDPGFAMKHLAILGTASYGPIAYLCWRTLVRPPWALAIGVIATLPFMEPSKPYGHLVLVSFVPISILFLQRLRDVPRHDGWRNTRVGIGLGITFGILFLTYSGWFQWAAPGVLVGVLILFPWRQAPRKAAQFLAVTGSVFFLVTGRFLLGLLQPAAKLVDDYVYFDVLTEPMYVAMFRGDAPGLLDTWPPPGELGGVGLFTILLGIGFGIAVALGRKTTIVIGLAATIVGAWLLRFFYARMLWETKLVQLFPRTGPLLLYCALALAGFAVYLIFQRLRENHPLRGPSATVGALCALLLLFASAGSATADRYMPSNAQPTNMGHLAYMAHYVHWGSQKKPAKARVLRWIRRDVIAEPE